MKKISVLIVEDHVIVREGLAMLLRSEPDIVVVGQAGDGKRGVALAKKTHPSVVVMDVALPLVNGVEATRAIGREAPEAKVLVLTSYGDEETLRQALKAGAVGFVEKDTAAEEVVRAIRAVDAGQSYFSPSVARRLREQRRDLAEGRTRELSTREQQVLQLVSEGFTNKQMAETLGISIKTVEKHRQQVMNKLGIHDRAGLTRYALAREVTGVRQ